MTKQWAGPFFECPGCSKDVADTDTAHAPDCPSLVMRLDEKGRCPECAIKPIIYKKAHGPGHPRQKFCHRCCRSYDLDTGKQQENWAWKAGDNGFVTTIAR